MGLVVQAQLGCSAANFQLVHFPNCDPTLASLLQAWFIHQPERINFVQLRFSTLSYSACPLIDITHYAGTQNSCAFQSVI